MKFNDITIKVNHFGPLENVSFKLAPLMVFTGLSSTGKSYANYLVYYLMSRICNSSLEFLTGQKVNPDLTSQEFVFSLDSFLTNLSAKVQDFMRSFLGDDTLLCDVQFICKLETRIFYLKIEKAESSENDNADPLANHSLGYRLKVNDEESVQQSDFSLILAFAALYIKKFILGETMFRSVILPPGRGAFVGENYSMKQEVGSSLGMYNYFFGDYDNGVWMSSRRALEGKSDDLSTQLLNLTSGGRLVSIEGKQYLELDKTHRLALSASASSVKDISPWLFYLKNPRNTNVYCLEEPEAHQHPSVTVQIADTIALSINQGNAFHLTTHSDYLIQRLNQLVKLGGIRRENAALFNQICDERQLSDQCYIDAENVHAYYFSKNKNGNTIVEPLDVTDEGIPMKSFFDVVRDLNEREDYINDAIYKLSKEQK